jgi:hypothetical protein
MNENPNCCGSGPCSSNPEVRVLPLGGEGNLILCWRCYGNEIRFRRERNEELSKDCQFDLPSWNSLKVYQTN